MFTSGATESNNLAILGVAAANADRGRHVITMRTEHKAVLDPVPPSGAPRRTGHLPHARAERAAAPAGARRGAAPRHGPGLASWAPTTRPGYGRTSSASRRCAASAASPFTAMGRRRCRAWRSTCVRWGSTSSRSRRTSSMDRRASVRSTCAPRRARALQPVSFGGGQERGLRPGTLAVHQIAGFGAACELLQRLRPAEAARLGALGERLWRGLADLGGVHRNGADAPRVPGIENLSFEGVEGESLFERAWRDWRSPPGRRAIRPPREPSYVLRALGRDARLAESSLRFSLGRFSTASRGRPGRVRRAPRGRAAAGPLAGGGACSRVGARGRRQRHRGGRQPRPRARGCGFSCSTDGDSVKEARCLAFACPHTVDTAQWLCERLRGRSRLRPDPRRRRATGRRRARCRSRNWGGCWWSKMHCVPALRSGTKALQCEDSMAISLTESAATRVKAFLAARGHGVGLRLGVRKTGCSGFAYVINYADEADPERRGIRGPRRAGVRGPREPRAHRWHGRGFREGGAERGLPLPKSEREGRVRLRRELLGLAASRAARGTSAPGDAKKALTNRYFQGALRCRIRLRQGKLRRLPGRVRPRRDPFSASII